MIFDVESMKKTLVEFEVSEHVIPKAILTCLFSFSFLRRSLVVITSLERLWLFWFCREIASVSLDTYVYMVSKLVLLCCI